MMCCNWGPTKRTNWSSMSSTLTISLSLMQIKSKMSTLRSKITYLISPTKSSTGCAQRGSKWSNSMTMMIQFFCSNSLSKLRCKSVTSACIWTILKPSPSWGGRTSSSLRLWTFRWLPCSISLTSILPLWQLKRSKAMSTRGRSLEPKWSSKTSY